MVKARCPGSSRRNSTSLQTSTAAVTRRISSGSARVALASGVGCGGDSELSPHAASPIAKAHTPRRRRIVTHLPARAPPRRASAASSRRAPVRLLKRRCIANDLHDRGTSVNAVDRPVPGRGVCRHPVRIVGDGAQKRPGAPPIRPAVSRFSLSLFDLLVLPLCQRSHVNPDAGSQTALQSRLATRTATGHSAPMLCPRSYLLRRAGV
jgi:hypothetical protein